MKYIKDKKIVERMVEKSRFIALIFPVHNNQTIKDLIEEAKKKYPKATHYCYGYVLENNISKCNDDGEPHGTAGKEIISSLLLNNIVNGLVIVIRYFHGNKLGASRLTRTYREMANEVIKACTLVEKIFMKQILVSIPIKLLDEFIYFIQENKIKVAGKSFDDLNPIYNLVVSKEKFEKIKSNYLLEVLEEKDIYIFQ